MTGHDNQALTALASEPLCDVAYCPWPASPDLHRCIVCGGQGVEHHHVEPRSQAPSRAYDPANIVILCRRHHEEVTRGAWEDHLEVAADGHRRYVVVGKATGAVIAVRRLPPPGASSLLERSPVVDALSEGGAVLPRLRAIADALEAATLDELEWAYQVALSRRAQGYWLQCLVAAECRARFSGLADNWADVLARDWGIDPSTVRRDARLGQAVLAVLPALDDSEIAALAEAADSHLRVIADSQVADKVAALRELARWLPEATERSARAFAAHLRRMGLKGGSGAYLYRCPQCGWQGRLRDFRVEAEA